MSDKGYIIPDPIDPVTLKCFKVYVPSDTLYIAAFWNAYEFFTKWLAWEHDGTDRAKQAAAVWRVAYELARSEYEAEGDCTAMPVFRIDPDTCKLQVDCGDGDWRDVFTEDTTPNDPDAPAPYPDPPPGQTGECLGAANITAVIKSFADQLTARMDAGGDFVSIVAAVMPILTMLFTIVAQAITEAVRSVIVQLNPDTVRDDYLAFDWDELKNIIVCYLEDDGSITLANWGLLVDDLAGRITAGNQMWIIAHFMVLSAGYGGMSVVALAGGITEAECELCCEWEVELDFTTGMHGFEPFDAGAGDRALYVAGQGWTANFSAWGCAAQIQRSVSFEAVKITLYASAGAEAFQVSAPDINAAEYAGIEFTSALSHEFAVQTEVTGLWLSHGYSHPEPCTSEGGYTQYLTKVVICGRGENPFE